MEASHGLPVPIQVRCEEKAFLSTRGSGVSQYDILLFSTSFDDIEDPIQAPFVPHLLHIWPYGFSVYLGRLCYHSNSLWRILLDMFLGARIDQIELEIKGRSFSDT